jgi:hypothetical protein
VLDEQFTYIRIFGFEGNPLLLPWFFCYRFLVYELCRKYRTWYLFFDKKGKQKFIPMPFNIAYIKVKSSSILTKMEGFFKSFNMKEVEACNGFDLEGIFTAHMVSIGYT